MQKNKIIISCILVFIMVFAFAVPCFSEEETVYVWSSSSNTLNTDNTTENNTNENTNTNNHMTNTNTSNTNTNSITHTSPDNLISNETNQTNTQTNTTKKEENAITTNADKTTTGENTLQLESPSAILMEQTTGKILYAHNIHEQLRPASVTKVMSILLIMEAIDSGKIALTDAVACSETASSMGGSQIWLDPRETLTVDEMLKAICVASANDCVVAMAEHIAGSEEGFVQMMNDRAKQLGMHDTTFKNCHGLDEDGHVTSSHDIALMSRQLMENHPEVTKYTTIWTDSLRDGKSQLANTNKLIRNYTGATGLKTGSTGLALYNLSATATRDDLSLIAVIMKAPSTKVRFAEAQKLLDYGFNTFSFKQFGKQGDTVQNVPVYKGVKDEVEIVFEQNAGTLLEKGKDKEVEQVITLQDNISAPIVSGQTLGEASFLIDGETISTVNLIAKDNIEKLNLFTISKKVIYTWIDLLRN